MIDSPSGLDWNPLRDTVQQTITAKLIIGDTDVTATNKCRFFFYRKLENGSLEQIVDGNGDNDWEFVSLNKNVFTFDRNYIGEDQIYVCKASYSKDALRLLHLMMVLAMYLLLSAAGYLQLKSTGKVYRNRWPMARR